jgi:AraC family transcriptional regulator
MVTEFNATPLAHPPRRSLSVSSDSFSSHPTLNGSVKLAHLPSSIDPTAYAVQTCDEGPAELLTLDKRDAAELEFSSQSHLLIQFPDGLPGGCEWSNGSNTEKLSSVTPNTILFNPPGSYLLIRKRRSKHCRILLLTIDPALVNRAGVGDVNAAELQFCQRIGIEDQGIRLTLAAIKQEIEAPGLNSRLYIDSLLMLLLTRLIRCASNFATPSQPVYVKGGLPNWRLKRALELFEADPSKMPSLAELAGPLRLHPTSFCRAFKQSTGLSPHRYFLEHRVNRAKAMMQDRTLTLTEIALSCGFSGSSQFSVVFKRITGVSPRNYRLSL